MSDKTKHLVAVYGTLKRGYNLHPNLTQHRAVYKGDATVKGTMIHLGAYPAVILNMEGLIRDIPCEIYEVDDDCLKVLDRCEGVPTLYQRVKVPTELGEVYLYVQQNTAHSYQYRRIIETGGWEGTTTPTKSIDLWMHRTQKEVMEKVALGTACTIEAEKVEESSPFFPKVVNI